MKGKWRSIIDNYARITVVNLDIPKQNGTYDSYRDTLAKGTDIQRDSGEGMRKVC